MCKKLSIWVDSFLPIGGIIIEISFMKGLCS